MALAVVLPLPLFLETLGWGGEGVYEKRGWGISQGEALGFRDEAPQYQKRIESRDEAFEARRSRRQAAHQARAARSRSSAAQPLAETKDFRASGSGGLIDDAATTVEAPRRKRRNSLLSG